MITTAKPNQARPSAWVGLLLLALFLLDASFVSASRVLNLDGVDDFAREPIGTASPSSFDLTTFTVEAWVFPTETLGSWFVFSDSGYELSIDASLGTFLTLWTPDPVDYSNLQASFKPVPNQWNHVAAGYDVATNRCFMAMNGNVDLITNCLSGAALDTGFDQLFGLGTAFAGAADGSQSDTLGVFRGKVYGARISSTLRYTANFVPVCPRLDAATVSLWAFGESAGATTFSNSSTGGRNLAGANGAATADGGLPTPCLQGGDFDGDGKSDVGIYRDGTWAIVPSNGGANLVDGLGSAAHLPVSADYDGDGKNDLAVYLPATGQWQIKRSSDSGLTSVAHGGGSFVPVPADYDGDGKADIAVYSGGVWSIQKSSDGMNLVVAHGGPGWTPVPADYDGDGKADIAAYIAGAWSIKRSSDSTIGVVAHGGPSWAPVPGDYDGDGKADVAAHIDGAWSVRRSSDSIITVLGHGGPGWVPVPADYDGDGKVDIAVYNTVGAWSIVRSSNSAIQVVGHGGGPSDIPLNQ